MTPQPLPTNLHPSQCYRLLDPEHDTLQEGDQRQDSVRTWEWSDIDAKQHGSKPSEAFTYRRPFTPPAPVQVQEFWRLLEKGKDTIQDGDEFTYNANDPNPSWKKFGKLQIGATYGDSHYPARRRVTVPVAAPAPVADAPKAESSGDYGNYRQRLFEYFDQNFSHAPTVSEMDEVEHIVLGYHHKPSAVPLTESGPFLVSVDGHESPTMEHATIEDARFEAERLARKEHPAQVRLLRQVAVARADMTVKWEGQNI